MRDLSVYFGELVDAGREPKICRTTREFLFMFERACGEIDEAKRKAAEDARRKVITNLSVHSAIWQRLQTEQVEPRRLPLPSKFVHNVDLNVEL